MSHELAEKVRNWAQTSPAAADYSAIQSQIAYLADRLYAEYEPTKRAGIPQFMDRLNRWLAKIPASNHTAQKTLFQLIPYLFFVGQAEFDSLYQAAFHGPVARWLIDQANVQLDDPDALQKIKKAQNKTWFCALTDSMQIAKFYHLNGISGSDLRPDWRVLHTFTADPNSIVKYMKNNDLERIVLLEDFVGSGSQIKEAASYAASLPGKPPVLLCPLLVCPDGTAEAKKLAKSQKHVTFDPVLRIPQTTFLAKKPTAGEPDIYARFRKVVNLLEPLVKGTNPKKWYGPFGFAKTGSLTVMYSNCPDNSLPVLHFTSTSWEPIFPRASRL